MTWTISHGKPNPGGPFDGYHSFAYGQVGDWRDAVAHVSQLTNRDLDLLDPLLRGRSGDPFTITAAHAGAIASILRRIHRKVRRNQRDINEAIAAAAERASAAGQPWRWS